MLPSAVRIRTMLVLNLAFIMERADEAVLPAAFKFIGAAMGATPTQLGQITLSRALVQAASSPMAGLLGDRLDRVHLVATGCLLWAACTAAIGMSTTLTQMMVCSGANGLGLALVIPATQSLVADLYPPEARGRAFGFLLLFSGMGGFAGFLATSLGGQRPYGIEGWRVVFYIVAAVSAVVGCIVALLAADPRRRAKDERNAANGGWRWAVTHARGMLRDIGLVLRIRSFQILILQGIVGSMPWIAFGWLTLYMQMLGFSDFMAASMVAMFGAGCCLGSFLGGAIGDLFSRRWVDNGRIVAAQLSVCFTFPTTIALLRWLPLDPPGGMASVKVLYGGFLFLMGSTISWSGTNNSAMFAEIVPEQLRSAVYAFDRSFEGAVGATGAPLVGLVAERVFGFAGAVGREGADLDNARALGNSLLFCWLLPFFCCFLFYFGLYFTLPADRERGRELGRQMAAAAGGPEAGRGLARLYHSKNSFCVLNSGSYADVLDALHGPEVPAGNGNFSKAQKRWCERARGWFPNRR
ncbi:hypothetical protein WJX81_000768 [Elliptochloris bilobata]|uniref:Major facilitator superfamily (MFS) profile domain-containing protein n=1 Tax=Elliptochloris bilobata TaxID=381761 RepID=A0AAW1RW95_9CHLO